MWMIGETEREIDASAARLRAAGTQVSWSGRHVGGYPFRLDFDFAGLALKDPSGWAVSLPTMKSEAYVFAPTHWLFAAPDGLTFTRPAAGAVTVTARLLRASASGWDKHPPTLAVEGDDLTFTPAAGAKPFWLDRARLAQLEIRPGPDDQGASYLGVEDGVADPAGGIGQLAAGKPVTLVAETTFTHASALAGPGWRASVLDWAHAGGALSVERLTLAAGDVTVGSQQGTLTAADDGALRGRLDATLAQPPGRVANLPAAPSQTLALTFHDGSTWLGPVKLGPAPRVF